MDNLLWYTFPNIFPILIILPACGLLMIWRPRDKRCELMFWLSLFIIPLACTVVSIGRYLSYLAPLKYDQYLYRIELHFGLPGYHMAQFLSYHPMLLKVVLTIYNLLPYEILAVFAVYLWKESIEEALMTLETQALLYLMIFFLYVVYPASGPNAAFAGFPNVLPNITTPHPIFLMDSPNCMPSGHFGTALLTLWFMRKWKWGAILSAIFVAGTYVATLTVGGHYTLDLIMAVPYTALIIYVSRGCGFLAKLGFLRERRNVCETLSIEPSIS
jgi:hypothetical protein